MVSLRWRFLSNCSPGKYTVKVSSSNGIFLRTVEQEVLVYPPPINASFIQGRGQEEAHQVVISRRGRCH